MTYIIAVYYDLISGPLRNVKIGLLMSFGVLGLIMTAGSVVGWVSIPMAIGFMYLATLLVMSLIVHSRTSAKLNDLHCELSLYRNLQICGYQPRDLYLDGAAANASLLLLLLKCLTLCRPKTILELGSGQSTKLLACYHRSEPGSYILTLEQDQRWVEVLAPILSSNGKCHDLRFAPMTCRSFVCPGTSKRISTQWFGGVEDLRRQKFNLILVDGPNGTARYSRAGILEYLPDILDKTFIIVFDDADRYGEIMTIRLLRRMLDHAGVKRYEFDVNGIKRQYVLCSEDVGFLQYS